MGMSLMTKAVGTGVLVFGLSLAVPAIAEMGGMMGGPQGQGMNQMSGMMHDMGDHMMSMSGQMSHGNMNASQQKQMSERMRNMATMMDHMSGMMGKGMMMDQDMQKQMGEMRMQMDSMMKESPARKKK